MGLDRNLAGSEEERAGGFRPSPALLAFLEKAINSTEDFYSNLDTEYERTIYRQFEQRFINLRNKFKGMLLDISNPDHEFINRTEMRKKSVEQILNCATAVAKQFQRARQTNRLDRPSCTDALENLIIAIRNLKHLIEEQGKI